MSTKNRTRRYACVRKPFFVGLVLAVLATASSSYASLPSRMILLLDGVSYADVQALQEGRALGHNKNTLLQAFRNGYYPASRLISTFPSISDPAWEEILGNPPPPGYQRTYFDAAKGAEVYLNGITSSAFYETQMTWQMPGSFRRVASYGSPVRGFKYELNEVMKIFLRSEGHATNFYAFFHCTDSAQHLWGDISSMLCLLDARLEELRAIYRAREGRELEILILSDHGNNHAGHGRRVAIKSFLRRHGYHVTKTLAHPKDVVLPTAGVESWIEVHNSASETRNLAELLPGLQGVDLVTAPLPDETNRFLVLNSKGERAMIAWNPMNNSYRYEMKLGDPLGYGEIVSRLAQKGEIDPDGFARADAWAAETSAHHYPIALERIVRGHTRIARNPASIIVSLKSSHVHCEWLLARGLALVRSGGTHGDLEQIDSAGVLLSNFSRTTDTSTSRVAALFDGFKGRCGVPVAQKAAEWASSSTVDRNANTR